MIIEIPLPPSANVYWRWSKRGPHRSKAAREYVKKVRHLYAPQPMTGRVAVRLDVFLCRGDLDNRIKVTLDALKGVTYIDDRQVGSLHVEEYEASSKTTRVVVRVLPWSRTPPMEDEEGFTLSPSGWKWPIAQMVDAMRPPERKWFQATPNVHTPGRKP